jgi:hypothetical protein
VGRPSLEGIDLKLNRAADRFGALTKAANKFLSDPKSCTLAMEDHPQPPGLILRVKEATSPPLELGLLIGEVVQQYRSALDHLAFQLLIANTQGRIPVKLAKRSEFPIFNSGPEFRGKNSRKGKPSWGSGLGKIRGIHPDAQAVIERLQPYHRRKNPGTRALWQLHELANIDKHRLLHITYGGQRGSTATFVKARNVAQINGPGFIPRPFKRNAIVAEYKVLPVDPRYGYELHMEPEVLTHITFGKGSLARSVRGQSVLPTLYGIGAFIASDVLPPLADLLGLSSAFKPGRLIDAEELSPSEREVFGGFAVEGLSLETPVRPPGSGH